MGYQSEKQLEDNLIKKLQKQGYEPVVIKDYNELVNNFRKQITNFNSAVLGGKALSDAEFGRLINHLSGKGVLTSAKILRNKFVLERDNGTTVYMSFISENMDANIYQVTNQITVKGRYENRYDVTILLYSFIFKMWHV